MRVFFCGIESAPRVTLYIGCVLKFGTFSSTALSWTGRTARQIFTSRKGGGIARVRAFQGEQSVFPSLSIRKATGRFSRALGRKDKIRQNLPGFEQSQSSPDVEQRVGRYHFLSLWAISSGKPCFGRNDPNYFACGQGYLRTRPSLGGTIACYVPPSVSAKVNELLNSGKQAVFECGSLW